MGPEIVRFSGIQLTLHHIPTQQSVNRKYTEPRPNSVSTTDRWLAEEVPDITTFEMTNVSLSSKLAEISLDVQDKRKTIDLLQNIITEQSGRHSIEEASFNRHVEESLNRKSAENAETLRGMFATNEILLQKKEALESRVAELIAEKQVSQCCSCHIIVTHVLAFHI